MGPIVADTPEVQYLVLPDRANPYLLARVRWPDVFQAISPIRPEWQDDPGLFDLPYDPSSWPVTREEAADIAAEWGAHIPADDATPAPRPLMRRMPANWSNLSRAEKRAWSIETIKPSPPAAPESDEELEEEVGVEVGVEEEVPPRQEVPASSRRSRRRRKRAGRAAPALELAELPQDDAVAELAGASANGADIIDLSPNVLDLTGTDQDALATAEDA